jgi:subtilase family serine protease
VFDSLIYAVEQNLAPIITLSYGSCETALDQADLNTMEPKLEEGESQGQTIIASSGDSGSTACYGYTGTTDGGTTFTTAMDEALAVNYPASSEYVTGVGGTEITAANDQVGTYWASAPSSNTITLTSALSHIPEVAWNDDGMTNCATYDACMSSTGGGISALISRPTWQTGVSGIPAGTKRLVPDVSLYASPNYPGYLYCTSDQSDWSTNQQGSCGSAEFYDPNSFDFTIAGGTSFAAPIFAGMVAVINQKMEYTGGQGLINPTLYSMAAEPASAPLALETSASQGRPTAQVRGNRNTPPPPAMTRQRGWDRSTWSTLSIHGLRPPRSQPSSARRPRSRQTTLHRTRGLRSSLPSRSPPVTVQPLPRATWRFPSMAVVPPTTAITEQRQQWP